ncbi:endonuclease domain-containing protein [Streptomyces sp. SGAir0957]
MHFRGKSKHESGISCKTHKIYSLSCDDFDALWARSCGACESCGYEPTDSQYGLVIDHDHKYGSTAVRGLICRWCNAALGKLENPDINPAFGPGPGAWFRSYFRRAWFVRVPDPQADVDVPVDRARLKQELAEWRSYNKALFSTNPQTALVPLNKPSVAAQILREEMSHQAFGALARTVKALAEQPRGSGATQGTGSSAQETG